MNPQLEWWRWLLLVLLFGGLGAVWLWLNRSRLNPRHWLNPPTAQRLNILERRWLSPKLTVYLMEVDGARFLLAQTPGQAAWQEIKSSAVDATPILEPKTVSKSHKNKH